MNETMNAYGGLVHKVVQLIMKRILYHVLGIVDWILLYIGFCTGLRIGFCFMLAGRMLLFSFRFISSHVILSTISN